MIRYFKDYIFIITTIFFTVCGQLLIKKGSSLLGSFSNDKVNVLFFLVKAMFKPYIMLGLICAAVGAIAWIGALSKFKLSYAYSFASLSFVFVMVFSQVIFKEYISLIQWIGIIMICLGFVLATHLTYK